MPGAQSPIFKLLHERVWCRPCSGLDLGLSARRAQAAPTSQVNDFWIEKGNRKMQSKMFAWVAIVAAATTLAACNKSPTETQTPAAAGSPPAATQPAVTPAAAAASAPADAASKP
jgi:hypothetical protein